MLEVAGRHGEGRTSDYSESASDIEFFPGVHGINENFLKIREEIIC